MNHRSGAMLALVAALAATLVSAAAGSGPGGWQTFAAGKLNTSDQIGLARTSDGVLHVVWHRHAAGGNSDELLHTAIPASGAIGKTSTIVAGWASAGGPSVVAQRQKLSVFFSATKTLT